MINETDYLSPVDENERTCICYVVPQAIQLHVRNMLALYILLLETTCLESIKSKK